MRFSALVDEALAHKQVERQRVGPLLDLFGDCTTDEMTPLLIDEKLRSVRGRSTFTIVNYRRALSRIFGYGVRVRKIKENPAISFRGSAERIELASNGKAAELSRKLAELRRKIETNRCLAESEEEGQPGREADPVRREYAMAQLRREAVSIVQRIAGEDLANAIRDLFGLRASERTGPRKREAYERAVLFEAKHPHASATAIAKHSGTDHHTVIKWQDSEDYQIAVKSARGEVPTEDEIRKANSRQRRSESATRALAPKAVRRKISKAVKKARKRLGAQWRLDWRRKIKKALEPKEVRDRISANTKAAMARPDVQAAQKAGYTPKVRARMSASIKRALAPKAVREKISKETKKALHRPGVRKRMSAARKRAWADPERRARQSTRSKNAWADPEYRARMSAARKRAWADPVAKASWVAAITKGRQGLA